MNELMMVQIYGQFSVQLYDFVCHLQHSIDFFL